MSTQNKIKSESKQSAREIFFSGAQEKLLAEYKAIVENTSENTQPANELNNSKPHDGEFPKRKES